MIEYLGPNRFYWTDHRIQIINDILAILPDRFKKSNLMGMQYKNKVNRDTMKTYLLNDPSEAIRSEEIIPVTLKNFEILEDLEMGGTILHMLFADIVNNFDDSREEDRKFIKLLCYFEKMMIKEKRLPSDFKLIRVKY